VVPTATNPAGYSLGDYTQAALPERRLTKGLIRGWNTIEIRKERERKIMSAIAEGAKNIKGTKNSKKAPRWLLILLACGLAVAAVLVIFRPGYLWFEWYSFFGSPHRDSERTLAELKKSTDVVVTGKFSAVEGIGKKRGQYDGSIEIVSTYFVFDVSDVVWDPQQLVKGSTIRIKQEGGIDGLYKFEVKNYPLFKVNEEAVLFLRETDEGPDLKPYYVVVGGPAGRFTVVEEEVVLEGHERLELTKPLTKADFISMIRATR
jgi:hypothetical protein